MIFAANFIISADWTLTPKNAIKHGLRVSVTPGLNVTYYIASLEVMNNIQLRDWFAGMAMQGLLAGKQMGTTDDGNLAEKSYQIAEAMLAKSNAAGGTAAPTPDESLEIEGIMGPPRR